MPSTYLLASCDCGIGEISDDEIGAWRSRKSSRDSMDKGKKRNRPKKDEETDVTYINDRNKVFNRKLVRYFDKYTKEYVFLLSDGLSVWTGS